MAKNSEILKLMYEAMLSRFGHQRWWPGDTPFEVAVGAVLTQNTSWSNVEKAIANLRALGALEYEGMRYLDRDALCAAIRPAGYFNQKANKLLHLLDWLGENGGGKIESLSEQGVQSLREGLLSINGIGPETADSIVLYALNKPTFVVDAYTHRIFARHEIISPESTYYEIKDFFEGNLPTDVDLFKDFHAQIVTVGKRFCRKREPACDDCPLKEFLSGPVKLQEERG
ncbi:MAG TPA: endonuclease III domain-containing protein [Candidatus Brocadiia bacterium]|nr:endonuclease III domain-containing protein [Candidatus Brocadiia bacterium]